MRAGSGHAAARRSSRPGRVWYGDGAILAAPEVVTRLGARRVLVVCGRRSFEASGAARVLPALEAAAQVRRWSDFSPNPVAADLWDGLVVAAEFRPDLVLGVGGGSALDTAKLIGACYGVPDRAALEEAVRAGSPAGGGGLPLVLAPTTSGSGSEATHFATIYLGQEKFSVAGAALRAAAVLLDPALTRSGSAYQRATSGIDAVAQAMESMWAVAATPRSRRWARHALGLLLPAIERFVADPEPRAARAMAIGSHLAGRAIDTSRTTAAHALSYAITQGYGVSHGHAVALTLGAFLEVHSDAAPERLAGSLDPDQHAAVMAELRARLGASDGQAARERFIALLRRLDLEPSLSAVGAAAPVDRAALAASVNTERLGNNPVSFSPAQLTELLERLD